jgi:hypothetical protein
MALKRVPGSGGGSAAGVRQRLLQLADLSAVEISAVYAAAAKLLVGGAESIADHAAARRRRHVELAAAQREADGAETPRIRS